MKRLSLSSSKINTAKAFSLVEVLIALALFAISAVVFTTSITSALQVMIGFEKDIEREEDMRFLRATIPYELTKEELLAGGKLKVIHAGTVTWTATLTEENLLDFWDIAIEYQFPNEPEPIIENYKRLAMGWMDPVDRSSKMTDKKELYPTDNRIPPAEAS